MSNYLEQTETNTCDVFIAGGGIIACTFASILVKAGLKVVMIDVGAQHSRRVGENLKNYPNYQIDVDQYGGIVRGLMHLVAIPPEKGNKAYTRNALNPNQDPDKNLPGAVVAYAVGGMAIHWTCAIPRHHKTEELDTQLITPAEWGNLYDRAEILLNRHTDVFGDYSMRHKVLKRLLKCRWPVDDTPLAAERGPEGRPDNPRHYGNLYDGNKEYVYFTGVDTVLDDLTDSELSRLTILPEHRVDRLFFMGGRVHKATVLDLRKRQPREFSAGVFIVAAGWVHTAQILWNSWIHRHEDSALGCYLHDHTFTACQVVLKKEIVDEIGKEAEKTSVGGEKSEANTLPIPMKDAPPHLYIPVDEGRPWQGLIFREGFQEAFLCNPVAFNVDSRKIVDLKWFGMIDPVKTNRMTFESNIHDRFGMPQPTFDFTLGEDDKERENQMMTHMEEVARFMGDYLPRSEPKRVPLGASTHTMGATRMGPDADDGRTSVVNSHSKVWGFDNLYVGGNCVIPNRNAANPTLTSVALAIRAANRILSSSHNESDAQQQESYPQP